MNSEHLNRTLRLLRRTGDKGIVIDGESDNVFVLMNTVEYEKLLDTADGVAPKKPISKPIAKEPAPAPAPAAPVLEDDLDDYMLDDMIEVEERTVAAPVAPAIASEPIVVKTQPIPRPVEKKLPEPEIKAPPASIVKEEPLDNVPDDGEEEKFYLEPIE